MGRMTRRLLIAAVAVAVVALALLLVRPMAQQALADRAASEVAARAATGLQAPVEVGSAAIALHPLRLVLRDLTLKQDGAFGLKGGASVERLEISGRWRGRDGRRAPATARSGDRWRRHAGGRTGS